jgi:hypothetical protein
MALRDYMRIGDLGDNHGSFPSSVRAHSVSELGLCFDSRTRRQIEIPRRPRSLTQIAAFTASGRKPGDGNRRRVFSVDRVA